MGMVQAHIIFSGTVQGVGFRFTSQRHALSLGLTGWVKNLPNGSVEIMACGLKETLELFCRNIEKDFEGYIRHREIIFVKPCQEFAGFNIVH